jgi:hypothetical protein
MNGEGSGIYGLIANNYVSVFIHKYEIRDTNLGEVLREWIEPEVVRQNGISDRDMSCYTFVEASVCKAADGSELSCISTTL